METIKKLKMEKFIIDKNSENKVNGLNIKHVDQPRVICRSYIFDPNRIINNDVQYLIHYHNTNFDFEILSPKRKTKKPDEQIINVVHDMNQWLSQKVNIGEITI